jgi:hypothetical protein
MSDGLNHSFKTLKHRFLDNHLVTICSSSVDTGEGAVSNMPKQSGVYDFDLQEISYLSGKVVEVVGHGFRNKETTWKSKRVSAYWLPWASSKAVAIDLEDDADYFFTSELNGCQIRVAALGEGNVKVIHVAGDGQNSATHEGSLWRSREAKKLLSPTQAKSSRRLSSLVPMRKDRTKYTGYMGDDVQWTNVFGFRREEQWEIWTQIVELDDDGIKTTNRRFWPAP